MVTNEKNEPIANAIVRLTDSGFETNTDDKGTFEMEIESGTFDLVVFAIDYKTYEQRNVVFKKDETTELNITLNQ